jgi:hypothetical protein
MHYHSHSQTHCDETAVAKRGFFVVVLATEETVLAVDTAAVGFSVAALTRDSVLCCIVTCDTVLCTLVTDTGIRDAALIGWFGAALCSPSSATHSAHNCVSHLRISVRVSVILCDTM